MIFSSVPIYADVYKCKLVSGKIEYQSSPCPTKALNQNKVSIRAQDPKVAAQANERFANWKAEQQRLEAIKAQEDKARQSELERLMTLDALRRSALAQEQQAAQKPVIINNYGAPTRPSWTERNHHPYQQKNQ